MSSTTTEQAIAKKIATWVPAFRDEAWWGDGASDPEGVVDPGGRVLAFVREAILAHDVTTFLDVYHSAMACWALHWLTLQERAEALAYGANVAGPITSIRTGDESIGFQQSAMSVGDGGASDTQYKETAWGKKYLSYRDTRPAAHLFVI